MSYLGHLKRNKQHHLCRWIVKYHSENGFVREVKLIFNPEEYRQVENSRPLHTQKGLMKILENDKEKRKIQ